MIKELISQTKEQITLCGENENDPTIYWSYLSILSAKVY